MNEKQLIINETLVSNLIAIQFPHWQKLTIRPVAYSGHDNRTFHLGEHLLVRLPSCADYALSVTTEQLWLPKLAPFLPLPIPQPLALGRSELEYLWPWSIYSWLPGASAAHAPINNLRDFAISLANFLLQLQKINATGGPGAGAHNFYRGGPLAIYDTQTQQAIAILKNKLDVAMVTEVWESALATIWNNPPVWVHGDISFGNLLVNNGCLSAVIDFGQLAVGDPACDLAITWTQFKGESREAFKDALALDAGTWARARGWTLWKALIIAADRTTTNAVEVEQAWHIIDEVITDYKNI